MLWPIFANSYQVQKVNVFLQLFKVRVRAMLSNYGSRQCGINQLTICYWPLAYSQLVFHWTGKVAPLILLNHSFRKLSLNWLGTEDSEKKKKIKLFCFFQIPSNFYYYYYYLLLLLLLFTITFIMMERKILPILLFTSWWSTLQGPRILGTYWRSS